jgi:hypothetical protein
MTAAQQEDRAMQLKIGRETFTVHGYADASALWCKYRDDNDLAGSNSPRVTLIENDGVRRNVSYNGKIWEHAHGGDWQPGMQPLFNPYAVEA